jgi:hypothetical protein
MATENAHQRRGAADCGKYRQAAEFIGPKIRKLNGTAAKKIKP